MQWLTELIGWPWYSMGYNYAFGAILCLPLVLWLLRVLGRHSESLAALSRAAIRWPVAILIVFIVVNGDVVLISYKANQLCREQGGLHIYRTVEAEGFSGATSIKPWAEYGFKYVDGYGNRYFLVDGEEEYIRIPEGEESRYAWGTFENRIKVHKWIQRSASHVVDRQTGEELGKLVWFHVYPGWLDRLITGVFGSHAWICGLLVPSEQNMLYGKKYDSSDLIEATIKPKR